jgi:hypothetical protein
LSCIVIGDTTIHHYKPESKYQTVEYKYLASSVKKFTSHTTLGNWKKKKIIMVYVSVCSAGPYVLKSKGTMMYL